MPVVEIQELSVNSKAILIALTRHQQIQTKQSDYSNLI